MPVSPNATQETSTGEDNVNSLRKSTSLGNFLVPLRKRNVLVTIPVFLVGIFRYTTLNVLIQYASVRFGMKISTGAMFYSETAIINIFLFLFLVPQLTAFVRTKYKIRPQSIDMVMVRASVCLMSLGAVLIGLAPSSHWLPIGQSSPRRSTP
jgi:hypothetical protein